MSPEQKAMAINWTAILGVIIAAVIMMTVGDVRDTTISSTVQDRFVKMHSEQLLRHSEDLRSVGRQLQSHDVRITRTEVYMEDVTRRLGEMQNSLRRIEDVIVSVDYSGRSQGARHE